MKKEDREKIIEWLETKWTKDKWICEICGTDDWHLSPFITAELKLENGSISMGGEIIPKISISCANCGNTKYFNAVTARIVQNNRG